MKAMVFAAGFGKRLGALTQNNPKPLIDINGKAMLERVIENLKAAGVDEVVINTHYLPEKIKDYVAARNNFGIKVSLIYEPEILGTGGGLKNAEQYFRDSQDIIVHNADVYCDLNLKRMLLVHRSSGAAATLAVMDRKTSRYLVFNDRSEMIGWENPEENKSDLVSSAAGSRLAFSGIQIVSRTFFDFLRGEQGEFSIIRGYLNAIKAGQKVLGHRIDDTFWIDVGTESSLHALREKLARAN